MSNTITIELCAEDRARLDRLTAALEAKSTHRESKSCIERAWEKIADKSTASEEPKDELQERLENTLKEAAEFVGADRAQATVEPQEAPASTDEPKAEEKPTDEENTAPVPEKTVTHQDLLTKVIEVSAKDIKLKAQARKIVLSYAPRVKEVPEDKLTECYNKIVALEG